MGPQERQDVPVCLQGTHGDFRAVLLIEPPPTTQASRSEQEAAEPGVRCWMARGWILTLSFVKDKLNLMSRGIVLLHSLALRGWHIYKSVITRICPQLCLGPVVWLGKPFSPLPKMADNLYCEVLPERLRWRLLSPWTRLGKLVLQMIRQKKIYISCFVAHMILPRHLTLPLSYENSCRQEVANESSYISKKLY